MVLGDKIAHRAEVFCSLLLAANSILYSPVLIVWLI